jgi:hypothetical protein
MTLEIQILSWDRHTNVAEYNKLMGSDPSLITGLQTSIHETNEQKLVQIRFHSNKGNNKITELRTILQRESQNS